MLSSKIEQLAVLHISTMASQPNSFIDPGIPINDKDMTFYDEIIVLLDFGLKIHHQNDYSNTVKTLVG